MGYVIAAVAGLVGALFLWDAWKTRSLAGEWARGVIVQGEVIGLLARRVPGPRVVADPPITPVVAYRTPQGEPGQFESSLGLYPSPYRLGDKVSVRYRAGGDPVAELDAALSHWSRFGSLLMGVVFSIVALLILFWDQVLGFLPPER